MIVQIHGLVNNLNEKVGVFVENPQLYNNANGKPFHCS